LLVGDGFEVIKDQLPHTGKYVALHMLDDVIIGEISGKNIDTGICGISLSSGMTISVPSDPMTITLTSGILLAYKA